jgi:hypothetical protein
VRQQWILEYTAGGVPTQRQMLGELDTQMRTDRGHVEAKLIPHMRQKASGDRSHAGGKRTACDVTSQITEQLLDF